MANLKVDLLNKLSNDKYYEEMELVRLAQEPNMYYKQKIDEMGGRLRELALLNSQIALIEQYFKDPQPAEQPQELNPVQQKPAGNVHQGQSHGE